MAKVSLVQYKQRFGRRVMEVNGKGIVKIKFDNAK